MFTFNIGLAIALVLSLTGLHGAIPLFWAYPRCIKPRYPVLKPIPYVSLGKLPTPVHKLETLGKLIGASNLYIKRDDLCGEIGGNKVRKLEFTLGEAVAYGAKGVMTWGFAGSNHTCATAFFCNKLGLECHCMHLAQPVTAYLRRNLLLSKYFGADLTLYPTAAVREVAVYQKLRKFKSENKGGEFVFIPSGGSNEVGAIGFVNAAFELKEQIAQGSIPEPDYLYVAIGSCATTAGLVLGLKAAGLKTQVMPINIEHDEEMHEHEKKFTMLFQLTNSLLHQQDSNFPLFELKPEDVVINHNFIGEGYAIVSQPAKDAINLLQQTDGIKLDGTYTSKAFAAMLDDIQTKNIGDKVILFWNTYTAGDFADITSKVDYKDLPKEYHPYFQAPLTANDPGA